MNCRLDKPSGHKHSRSGFSFLEVLLALAISSAFLGGVYATFIHINKSHNASEGRLEAMRNARAALISIDNELKQLDVFPDGVPAQPDMLIGLEASFQYGDGIDNNGDGFIDEEKLNGLPVRGYDPAANVARELTTYTNKHPDPGDIGVDKDIHFGRDVLRFTILLGPPSPQAIYKVVEYRLSEVEGESNYVLVRTIWIKSPNDNNPDNEPPEEGLTSPLAFNVLGFDVIYWNPQTQRWRETWDSNVTGLPTSIYVRLTMKPGAKGDDTFSPGQPIEALTLESMFNIESMIDS